MRLVVPHAGMPGAWRTGTSGGNEKGRLLAPLTFAS